MAIKKMIIKIERDGRTKIRVEGGQGDDCLAFTNAIEQALGKVEQRELTADYQEKDSLAVTHHETLHESTNL